MAEHVKILILILILSQFSDVQAVKLCFHCQRSSLSASFNESRINKSIIYNLQKQLSSSLFYAQCIKDLLNGLSSLFYSGTQDSPSILPIAQESHLKLIRSKYSNECSNACKCIKDDSNCTDLCLCGEE